ncbi:hypothetical protein ABZX95_42895 [Streptomyces sp. NPDC004232]|uniref:hypothetical protein n=1 Tax=Streptomyces sp. NPDC004232 TaxID=3154454 RepID=UPI001DE06BDC|nr:hypothetical protein [Streptomyces sp. tea 10]
MDNRLTMPGTYRVLLLALPAAGAAVAAVLTLLPQERPHMVVRAPARAALRVLTGVPGQHPQGRPVRD